jgi:hypothetical protein
LNTVKWTCKMLNVDFSNELELLHYLNGYKQFLLKVF